MVVEKSQLVDTFESSKGSIQNPATPILYCEINLAFLITTAWEQRKLGEVAKDLNYGVGAAAIPYDGKTRYLRITDIDDETREFLNTNLSSPDPNYELEESAFLNQGDIVFARTGASVGKTYLNRENAKDIVFAGFLIRASFPSFEVSEFVYQQTLTKSYSYFIDITSQRSGQPGVNAQEFSNWAFWFCNEREQKQIGSFLCRLDSLITLHQRK